MCPGFFGRMSAKGDHGRVVVPSLNRMISFRTVRPNPAGAATLESEGQAPTLLRTPSASDSQKKVRVLWNVDAAEVSAKLGDHVSDDANEPSKTPMSRQWSRHTSHACETVLDESPQPIYEDSERIEYFSVTHQLWMTGTLHVETRSGEGDPLESFICYSVALTNGQLREDVGLDVLRRPFAPGELVELSSGQKAGLRLAAVIAPDQSSIPSMLGYHVFLDGTIQSFDRIPLLRLKRRFPAGRYVEVYRGAQTGWQMAKVHAISSADGCKAEMLPAPPAPPLVHADLRFCSLVQNEDQRKLASPQDKPAPAEENQPNTPGFGIWTLVPICHTGAEDMEPEYVPSYLVRLMDVCEV